MSLSMYQASAPLLQRILGNFAKICEKAAAHCAEKGIAEDTLLNAQLFSDMYPFKMQALIVATYARMTPVLLAGAEPPAFVSVDLPSFAAVQKLLAEAQDVLASATPASLEGSEERVITVKAGENELKMKGRDYLQNYALPNFFFHFSTAYGILRSQGVVLGKADIIGAMDFLIQA